MRLNSCKSKLIIFNVALILGILAFWISGSILLQDDTVNPKAVEIDPLEIRPLANADDEPCDWLRPDRKLRALDAVRLAECFIEVNGYTDKPPIADRTKLTPENVYPGTDDYGMKMRHKSLESKAFGYWDSKLYGGGWEIAFRLFAMRRLLNFTGRDSKTRRAVYGWITTVEI